MPNGVAATTATRSGTTATIPKGVGWPTGKAWSSAIRAIRLSLASICATNPASNATWGGSATRDWHAAAQRGGNAVLAINPHLLIFVEGVNYALDLSGVAALPVQLNTAGQLVYEAHNYSWDYSGLTDYNSFVTKAYTGWGYLVTGPNPQALWIGEFGTCNTATTCVSSTSSADGGYWFSFLTTYIQQNSLDWSYWAINGTQTTGSTRTYGAPESYGVLNPSWNGSALGALTSALQHL